MDRSYIHFTGRTLMAFILFFLLTGGVNLMAFPQQKYSIRGEIIDKITRESVPFATVSIWQGEKFAVTDSSGIFEIRGVDPGVYRIQVDILGYSQYISEEIMVSASGGYVRAELEEESTLLEAATVKPKADPFRRIPESPTSQKTLGVQEIEKNAGSNRDISRVIGSLPGVGSVVTGGYRNDILVRGGGPSENKFYYDGIEIPTINHFSTQGSAGGPVGIIDADFIREADFYAGNFPVARGGALSSVLDLKLKDPDPVKNNYKFTVGASEAGFSSGGHLSEKTNYLVSARTSYLQFLFKAIGLPFLPTFSDAQFKIETRFDNRHHLSFIGIAGIDDMTLNEESGGEDSNDYILSYLPVIEQEVFTLGAIYKYFYGRNSLNLYLSHSYLNNRNTKYRDNDDSSEENLNLRYRSVEQETRFRAENLLRISDFRFTVGFGMDMPYYENSTYQRIFYDNPVTIDYYSDLSFFKYSVFGNLNYTSPDRRLVTNIGLRADANTFSSYMSNPLNQFSPRLSLSYELFDDFYINASGGRYFQLPPYTAMGFRDNTGILLNKDMKYLGSDQVTVGFDYRTSQGLQLGMELFHKWNFNGMYSVNDSIPVEGKGTNYGVVGNELIESTVKGRSYGAEFALRWFVSDKFNLIGSLTLFRSKIKYDDQGYLPSSWDSRRLMTISGGYRLPRNYTIGAKFRYSGGAPYTPLDVERSSLVAAWDASGRVYRDYSRYNSIYLKQFNQLDIRVDKEFYFPKFALKIYLDVQNALNKQYKDSDVLISTGRIVNPDAPYEQQRYEMKRVEITSGTVLPTIGLTLEL